MQTLTATPDTPLMASVSSTASVAPPAITLTEVLQEFEHWRASKANPGEPIPDALWQKIFALATLISPAKLRAIFGISNAQYQKKSQALCPSAEGALGPSPKASAPPLDFCEAKVRPPQPFYQPQKLPTTPALVVEFCRADGHIMKIHTTTDSFKTLIALFLAEDGHAANHP